MSTYLTSFPSHQNAWLLYPILSTLVYNFIHNIQYLSLWYNLYQKACILKQRNQLTIRLCTHAPNPQRKQRLCQNVPCACWFSIHPAITFHDWSSPFSFLNLAPISHNTHCPKALCLSSFFTDMALDKASFHLCAGKHKLHCVAPLMLYSFPNITI